MKKWIIMPVILLTINSYAQRDGGDLSASLLGGYAKQGFQGQIHVDYYITYTNLILQGRLIASSQNLPTEYDAKMNLQQYGFSALIGWSPEKQIRHPFFLNFLAGLYLGYDYGNKGKDIFSDYNIPFDADKFNKVNYGFTTSMQGEINLSEKWSLIGDFTQIFRFNAEFGKYTYYISGGLKYYF